MLIAPVHLLCTRPVIRHEHYNRVVINFHSLQLVKQPANFLIYPVDHGGMNGHLCRMESFLLI
ncbi:MAG: hypothetical protein A2350_00085 [Candidatus Raymondbacteria bacterium RifOxyB12_full_50_8]|nr:MAG: hypothetical protein A2350_00085 [Candidatus Raymondbacteria bacterium RifOxyB12_full_50_8]